MASCCWVAEVGSLHPTLSVNTTAPPSVDQLLPSQPVAQLSSPQGVGPLKPLEVDLVELKKGLFRKGLLTVRL